MTRRRKSPGLLHAVLSGDLRPRELVFRVTITHLDLSAVTGEMLGWIASNAASISVDGSPSQKVIGAGAAIIHPGEPGMHPLAASHKEGDDRRGLGWIVGFSLPEDVFVSYRKQVERGAIASFSGIGWLSRVQKSAPVMRFSSETFVLTAKDEGKRWSRSGSSVRR